MTADNHLAAGFAWEQHCCLPIKADCDIAPLERYRQVGVSYVSVNVGFAPHGIAESIPVLSSWRRQVRDAPASFELVGSADQISAAQQAGRLVVGFDLEDTNPLGGQLSMVQTYYDLGVRSMLLTYNSENLAGFGCHAARDDGLTSFGRDVVDEMNRVGMIVDVSHCGYRTSMEAIERSSAPVIFSHSSMRGIWEHDRNIRDDQVLACAASGGVIGINGVGIFLGDNDASPKAMARHIDYAVQLVGPGHVGVGTDYVFDNDDLSQELANSQVFPESYQHWDSYKFLEPEQLPQLETELHNLGYSAQDTAAIMGGNFLRVAKAVWKPAA
jgi:microsomal dipeptidase-like Zn-dependent dipeptidase